MMSGLETWKNAGNGLVYVVKTDRYGNENHELVNAGKSFSLTRDERLLNMDRAASKDQDLFQNGTLVPVRLLEGDEEAAELASSPNLMGESAMKGLFKGHWKTFESKIADISNPGTLARLREVAEQIDATVRQVGVIDRRIQEIAPSGFSESEVEVVGGTGPGVVAPREDSTGRPVSPK